MSASHPQLALSQPTAGFPLTNVSPLGNTSASSPLEWVLGIMDTSDSEENRKRWSSFIGIVVAVCGNVLISLALNIQKYAHIRLEREAERRRRRKRWLERRRRKRLFVDAAAEGDARFRNNTERRQGHADDDLDAIADADLPSSPGSSSSDSSPPNETSALLGPHEKDFAELDQKYLSSPYWWTGLTLMSIGECGNFLAYGFAPASIVSPLGVVALISNCVIAPVMLGEEFRGRDLMGVLVSIMGAVTVVWSAEKEETKLGPDEILRAISQTAFEVYFGITLALIIGLIYLSSRYGHRLIIIDLGLVALFGGYTVLSTKGISSLISTSFYHIFAYPIAYLFAFVLITTAIFQIKYLNRALQRFDSTVVIPTQFVLFTISVIVGSAILYRDFEKVDARRLIKFTIGCCLTFWGVYFITTNRSEKNSCGGDDDEAEEGVIDLDDTRALDSDYDDHPSRSEGTETVATPSRKPSYPPKPDGAQRRPTLTPRGMSTASSVAATEASTRPVTPSSDILTMSPTKLHHMTTSEPLLPGVDAIQRGPMHSPHRNSIDNPLPPTPKHRRSTSMLPGPIVAGYQLHAVIADHVGGSLREIRDKGNKRLGTRRANSNNKNGREEIDDDGGVVRRVGQRIEDRVPYEPETTQEHTEEEDTGKRARSSSLSVVLDFVKGRKRPSKSEQGGGGSGGGYEEIGEESGSGG